MCGCETCIIAKSQTETLAAWRTKYSNHLGDKARRSPPGRVKDLFTKKHEVYQREAFKEDGSRLWCHPREAVASMTCAIVTPSTASVWSAEAAPHGLHKLSCSLNRCVVCDDRTLPVPESEQGKDEVYDRKITYHECECNGKCAVHWCVGSVGKCPHCEEEAKNKKTDKKNKKAPPKFSKKKLLTKKTVPIGIFMSEVYPATMKKYRMHILYVALLGKHHCVNSRQRTYRSLQNGSVLTQRDCADHLKSSFNLEIQSTHFGDQPTCSMENVTVRQVDETLEEGLSDVEKTEALEAAEVMDFHSYVSDDKQQDAHTTFLNTVEMVRKLRSDNPETLCSKESSLFELMDGCTSQCRCATSLFFMSLLAVQFKIIVNRMISASGHGKGDCDSQGGVDKTLLAQHMETTQTPEVGRENNRIEAHQVVDGRIQSLADTIVRLLNDPARLEGAQSRTKRSRMNNKKFKSRFYKAMHHGNTHTQAISAIPLQNTRFKVTSRSFPKKKNEKHNGIMAHYHFLADWRMGTGVIAARRIPCSCRFCVERLEIKWEKELQPALQPRFQPVPHEQNGCVLKEVLGSLNDWKIVTVMPDPDHHQPKVTVVPDLDHHQPKEIEGVFGDVLDTCATAALESIKVGSFAAINAEDESTDGHYLVRWTGNPYTLQQPAAVEGCDQELPAGELVCEGIYWHKQVGTSCWYTPPVVVTTEDKVLFRVRYVVSAEVEVEGPSDGASLPKGLEARLKKRATVLEAKRVTLEAHDRIMDEIAGRALMDYYEDDEAAEEEEEEEDNNNNED